MGRPLRKAVSLSAVLLCFVGCQQKSQPLGLMVAPGTPDAAAVGFDITPVNASAGGHRWLATYTADGKTAKFGVEFAASKASGDKDFRASFGKGRFLAEPGSDASGLLMNLKKALEAKNLPKNVTRVSELSFTYATIGEKLSQAAGGGFNAEPAGDWTATKIFLAGGEAEVLLNTNPKAGKAEFSIKDPEYGDQVLAELAKVL